MLSVYIENDSERSSREAGHAPLLLDAVSGCCWMVFITGGISVTRTSVEKFLWNLNSWNGCYFPEQFGFYCVNTECTVSKQISLFLLAIGRSELNM